jgi:acetyl esterase/lipase
MRLLAAGVSVELHSYPGTFHGSALAQDAAVSRRMSADLVAALARSLT